MIHEQKQNRTRVIAAVAIAALPMSAMVFAADTAERGRDSTKKGAMSSASMEMHQSMMKDMKEMQGMKPSGNMDHDFATMMGDCCVYCSYGSVKCPPIQAQRSCCA